MEKTPWIGSEYQCSLRCAIDWSGVRGNAGSARGGGFALPKGLLRVLIWVGRTLTVGDSHRGSRFTVICSGLNIPSVARMNLKTPFPETHTIDESAGE